MKFVVLLFFLLVVSTELRPADAFIDDVGEKVGKLFSWAKKQWSKAKVAINQLSQRIGSTNATETAITTTAEPKTEFTDIPTSGLKNDVQCGVNRYADEAIKNVKRRSGRQTTEDVGDGLKAVSQRISGGRSARKNEAPWLVRVSIEGNEQCGATILNSRTIITAAHCVESTPDVTKYKLYLADHSLTAIDNGEQVASVAKIIRHPRYDQNGTWANDFALLITTSEIAYRRGYDGDDDYLIRPICLPTRGSFEGELAGLGVTISGWGHFDSAERDFARILQLANVRVINQDVCRSRYRQIKTITKEMLCAGFDAGDVFVDACSGDSGGSMTALRNGRFTLLGVTSFGLDCNNKDKIPGVYARVTTALSWIEENAMGSLHFSD